MSGRKIGCCSVPGLNDRTVRDRGDMGGLAGVLVNPGIRMGGGKWSNSLPNHTSSYALTKKRRNHISYHGISQIQSSGAKREED